MKLLKSMFLLMAFTCVAGLAVTVIALHTF
jgi:hypothetical protein